MSIRSEIARRLPVWLQPTLTFMTGKAGTEQPTRRNTPASVTISNLVLMAASVGVSTTALLPSMSAPNFAICLEGMVAVAPGRSK